MKFIKKINRGLILTVAVILALLIYLTVTHFSRYKDREEIRTVIHQFAQKYSTAALLADEDIKNINEKWSDEACELLSKKTVEQCKPYFVDNEKCVELLFNGTTTMVRGQNSSKLPIKELSVSLVNLRNFSFDGDTVSLTAEFSVKYTGPATLYSNDERETEEISKTFLERETLVLQKENGQWKLFYFDGDFFSYDYSSGYEEIGG